MTLTEEMTRFKAKYTAAEWKRLMAHPVFLACWEFKDVVRAGEVASGVLYGDFKTAQVAKWISNLEF